MGIMNDVKRLKEKEKALDMKYSPPQVETRKPITFDSIASGFKKFAPKAKTVEDLKAEEKMLKAKYALEQQKSKIAALKAKNRPAPMMGGGSAPVKKEWGVGGGASASRAFGGTIGSSSGGSNFSQRKRREWKIG